MTKSNTAIEHWPVSEIKPYPRNAKKHSEEQIATLAESIDKLGWTALIVVDKDGVIITGHGRRLAAIKLGRVKVPVICRRDLSPLEADALRLADNRISSTEYDQALLQEEISKLNLEGFDIGMLGFTARELEFSTADMADLSETLLVDDVSVAVEDQKAENAAKVAAVEDSDTPVSDAFGFKRVSVSQSRRIKAFMTLIEEETGLKGIEALLAYAAELGA